MPFLSAKELFWSNVEAGWKMAKARAKLRHRNIGKGWLIVKPDDVVAVLEKRGIKVTRRTLLNYEKWNLVPKAIRGSAGKGRGRTTDYPDETPAEFYASLLLKQKHGLKVSFIARCREKGLLMESKNEGLGFADWLFGEVTPETMQEVGFGQTWLKEKHRVLCEGRRDDCPVCKKLKIK
jgi:hypothetical protein